MEEKLGRREQKKKQSYHAILQAAVRQFGQKGYQETSVADIMQAAQLGIGTFYNYFASKEELLMRLLEGITGELQAALDNLGSQPHTAADSLEMMTLRTAQLLSENRFVLPLFLSAADKAGLPAGMPAQTGSTPAFKTMFGSLIRQGQEAGEFRTDIPEGVVTEMFHSMFQAASFSSLPLGFEENIRLKLRLVLDGLEVKDKEYSNS
jgi:AcrR family transcriptional regulator